jgi:flagellar biosynthesis/type III secretory pathway protein FliH
MRHPPCPSYDVPSRSELAREAMDEARAEAYDEGHEAGREAGYRDAWREAMEAITVALRETIAEWTSADDDVTIRDVCRTVLERLDASYSDVPDPSVLEVADAG